jgi:hypothetical protein
MTGLAYSSTLNALYSLNGNGGQLLSVNPVNGSATGIGPSSSSGLLDLAFDSAGDLFGAGYMPGLYAINPLTGAETLIGGTLEWRSIAFDQNGILYGISLNGPDAADLYIINTLTGAATLVGQVSLGATYPDIRGLGFVPDATPLPAALPLFATGLAGLGLLGWRRKRKAQVA